MPPPRRRRAVERGRTPIRTRSAANSRPEARRSRRRRCGGRGADLDQCSQTSACAQDMIRHLITDGRPQHNMNTVLARSRSSPRRDVQPRSSSRRSPPRKSSRKRVEEELAAERPGRSAGRHDPRPRGLRQDASHKIRKTNVAAGSSAGSRSTSAPSGRPRRATDHVPRRRPRGVHVRARGAGRRHRRTRRRGGRRRHAADRRRSTTRSWQGADRRRAEQGRQAERQPMR